MIIMYDAAGGTNGNVISGLMIIVVSGLIDINQSSGLSASDPLLFSCNTDGTAADAYFYKVCSAFSQKTKAFAIDNISCSDFNGIPILFSDPMKGSALPL